MRCAISTPTTPQSPPSAVHAPTTSERRAAPSISVKLSALHPRYERAQGAKTIEAISTALSKLARTARAANVALTVDAEEADRLELSLAIFARVFRDPALRGYEISGSPCRPTRNAPRTCSPGSKSSGAARAARFPCAWSRARIGTPRSSARRSKDSTATPCSRASRARTCPISRARTRCCSSTRISFRSSRRTTRTPSRGSSRSARNRPFEFQRLHGMGEELYAALLDRPGMEHRCRVYAPVGSHQHLLPYLVRRLLENGANTSFVNRLVHAESPAEAIVEDPVESTRALGTLRTRASRCRARCSLRSA